MSTKLLTGFVAAATAGSALLFGSPAQAQNLKTDSPDFYNYIVDTYIQDERVEVANAADHKPGILKAIGNTVDVFFVDTEIAYESLATFADRIQYSVNGDTSDAFGARRVDNGQQQVTHGEGFTLGTQAGDVIDFSLLTKGFWDNPNNPGFVLGSDESKNVDGLQHIVAYSEIVNGESWTFWGFEDVPVLDVDQNGVLANEAYDWDYNDAFLAVRGAKFEAQDVPEPTTALMLLAGLGVGAISRRRKH